MIYCIDQRMLSDHCLDERPLSKDEIAGDGLVPDCRKLDVEGALPDTKNSLAGSPGDWLR